MRGAGTTRRGVGADDYGAVMDREIARWRLRSQLLSAPHAAAAVQVVHRLLGVQAENPGQSAWAVATRTTSPDPDDLSALLSTGTVLRTHVLRPTWHYVLRDDLDWLLALTGPRVDRVVRRGLLASSDLEAGDLELLAERVLAVLSTSPDLTRAEVRDALREEVPRYRERLDGQVLMLLMAHLELTRRVCSGRPQDGAHTYATWDDRVGARVELDGTGREEALGRLALRYFAGHGPATEKDLSYWASLPLTDVRRGVQSVRDRLAGFEHQGRTFWHAADEHPREEAADPPAHLLQLLDESYRGYQDSRWVLDGDGVVPRGRETSLGIALLDAQMVAGVRRTLLGSRRRGDAPGRVRFEISPHRTLSPHEVNALEDAARRYGRFLGRQPELVLRAA